MQVDLFSSGPGRDPLSRGYPEDDEAGTLPLHHRGRRCARCGRRLGVGWTVVGAGMLCRYCVRVVSPSRTIRKVGREVCPKRDKMIGGRI
ncbi:hypothetical protein [Candidatus Methanocrinis natronophilus]|uniref:FPG-type domain-containing protein n=1 Tax=Candidatus Methanocrinis natronophilus TaxID=3033396 RepID=A0ABT5XAP4_9EURY|nr:hypothetical protein [Candidatus Methanocrinis natronophilus]MDF0591785.1 hypothetical protein [Candidatus Methanocrinis natronophilus]